MKDYCLLENGEIHACYYGDGKGSLDHTKPRNIYKEGRYWYLDHDVYLGFAIAYCHSKIIKFADTAEELKNEQGN